jgi:hypothetical protein
MASWDSSQIALKGFIFDVQVGAFGSGNCPDVALDVMTCHLAATDVLLLSTIIPVNASQLSPLSANIQNRIGIYL